MQLVLICLSVVWLAASLNASIQTDMADTQSIQTKTTGPMGRPAGVYREYRHESDLRLAAQPTVHSVSATTANLTWTTSLPAMCTIAWGPTNACQNNDTIGANYFGSYSLTDLKPGTTYYFQINSLEIPRAMEKDFNPTSTQGASELVTFTTLTKDAAPQTYFVTVLGADANSGKDIVHAWRTIRYAATQVNVGDTVQIAAGQYDESIRVLATGSPDSPITFKAMPGQKVMVSGDDYKLTQGFIATGKQHLRFDGLYFTNFNVFPLQGWLLQMSGEFSLHHCNDIQITRCFSDGRGGYSARFITAWDVDHLLVQNCVIINKMSGSMMLWPAPNFRLEHSVIARPMISSFVLRNGHHQMATFSNNIFTDMLAKKAKLNINLLTVDSQLQNPEFINNCFYLREYAPDKRIIMSSKTGPELKGIIINPVYANPAFAGDKTDPQDYGIDHMIHPQAKLDFDDFFTTNVKLIQNNIGLQREVFSDRFNSGAQQPTN